ncbi:type II secretion system protein [Stenotrophomonas sp. JAG2]|uniref:type II secretion system protein n=1 Tax=Stenotrophomonas sp. JAG2 TaxID=3229243 RepID=UPI0034E1DC31
MLTSRIRGFSFVELIASLAILGMLLGMAVPVGQTMLQRHRETELRRSLAEIRLAIDRYKRATETGKVPVKAGDSGYPPDLQVLVDGVTDASSPTGATLYFLRRIPRDPFHRGTDGDPAAGWGLRSYASSADDPQPGEDVFDVYSQSRDKGLNEVPYARW